VKARAIQTRFWDDEFVAETDLFTQHLYLYLLTCQYINLCGIFQLPTKKIMLEAKLTEKQFEQAKMNLEVARKVVFYGGWVYVVNAEKNNAYVLSDKNKKPLQKELEQVPEEIKSYFLAVVKGIADTVSIGYPAVADTTRNQKPETHINNPNHGGVGETKPQASKSYLTTIPPDDLTTFGREFNLSIEAIQRKGRDLLDWCDATGKRRKDYKAFLRVALSKDADDLRKRYGGFRPDTVRYIDPMLAEMLGTGGAA
jgi:hypothetical protein